MTDDANEDEEMRIQTVVSDCAAEIMNPERFPTTGAGASAKVTLRLARGELLALDRFCAENKLTRSQVIRRALKGHLIQRAIGREE